MSETGAMLDVRDLALSRGERLLIRGLSFTLSPGQLLLLRGPNGIGKSSLLLLLANILRPEAGSVAWARAEPPPLHFLGHQTGVKPRLTLAENLAFWRAINGPTGLPPGEALDEVGLGDIGNIEAGHLSAGQTRRLALARLLVTDRILWLLDEPTASLDADGDALVARLIARRLATGGAVIAATHHDIVGATGTLTLGSTA
jgi:heme exporter protein A